MEKSEKNSRVAVIFGLCAAYFICYLTKLSPSAVMPQIQEEMNLSSSVTGFISGIYFFAYAGLQFFVGPLCKRFTAPVVILVGMVLSAVGLLMFAEGTTVFFLAFGRFLIGLGTAPVFVGLCHYFQKHFSGQEYVRAYGYSMVVGNIGSICASAPLKALLSVADRKTVFSCIAVASLALGLFLLFAIIRTGEKGEKESKGSIVRQIGNDISYLFSEPVLRVTLVFWIVESVMLMSYQGLWCIKWTTLAYPEFASLASFSGIAVSLGVIFSGRFAGKLRFFGPLVNRNSSWKETFYASGWLAVAAILFTAVSKFLPQSFVGVVISLLGDFLYGYAGGNIVFHGGAIVKNYSSDDRNANVMGVLNGFGCFAQQLSQWGTGVGVDIFSTVLAMNMAFGCTYAVVAVATVFAVVVSRRVLIEVSKPN